MSRPLIFISYSHKDEEEDKEKKLKDRLISQLGVAERQGQFDVWWDNHIPAGDDWDSIIQAKLKTARVAILMVTAHFLRSDYVLTKEIPVLLERRKTEGVLVFPILTRPCDWENVEWLREIQMRPTPPHPLSTGTGDEIDGVLANIAKEIREWIKKDENKFAISPKTTFERPKTLQPKFGPSLLSENYLAIKEEVGKLDDFTDLYYQTDTWLNKLTALGKKIDEVNKEINKQPTPLGKKFEETSKELTDKSRVMEDVRRAIRLITGEEGLISKFDEAFDEISGQLKTFTDSISDLTQKQKELDKVILRLASGIVGIMNQEKIENLRQIKRSLHSICSDVGIKLDEYENEPVSTEALENYYIKIRSIFQGLKNSLPLNDLRRAPESLRLSLYEEIRGSVKILTTLTAMSKEVQQQ